MGKPTSDMRCPVEHQAAERSASAAAGKCPFNHGQFSAGKSSQAENGHIPPATRPSSEAHAALNGCPMGYTASEPVQQPQDQAACPMAHGTQNGTASQGSEAAPAQCPMGFTAADGPRMTAFHCVICKSLLYDCVQLSCACKYCRHCVANFRDCPLCGADITSRTPDTELQGTSHAPGMLCTVTVLTCGAIMCHSISSDACCRNG